MTKDELAIGDSIEVNTERLAYGGEAVAHHKGLAIFIHGGAPTERLRVKIIERKKRFARAVIEEIITPSASRREPPCKYFGECGGCQLQHIRYETQLSEKVGFIRDALQRTGQINWPEEITIHAANEFQYRLRAKLNIGERGASTKGLGGVNNPRNPVIGFNRARSHQVCDIEYCEILLPELNDALQSIRAKFTDAPESLHKGIKEIEIAVSQNTVSESQAPENRFKVATSPPVAGFPSGTIQREIAETLYQFAPSSFFQVNALLLDEFVKEAVGIVGGNLAIDLYAGVGLFTIQLAHSFKQVIGVESNPHSVEFANLNITGNKMENVDMEFSRVDRWLNTFLNQPNRPTPDLVLLDPPRIGAPEAIDMIGQLNARHIHYVSCDPVTLARDLKQLIAANYEIEGIVAFDMFPQTYHVETIVFLRKR